VDRRRREFANRGGGTSDDHYDLIRQAITNQQPAMATYQGSRRQFCAHVLGRQAGRHFVLAFQYSDSARQGPAGSGWQCFALDRLQNVSLLGSRWRTGEMDSLPEGCIETAEVVVEGFDVSALGAELDTTGEAALAPLRKQES
jgi:hypothetical protein